MNNNISVKKSKNYLNNITINPFFKEKIILTIDYKYQFKDYRFYWAASLSVYDIYKLNKINDSIYLAFVSEKSQNFLKGKNDKRDITVKCVTILKYNFINETTTEKAIINAIPKKIRYFYDKINNKEYLFILEQVRRGLKIFLIKSDIEYKEIHFNKEIEWFNNFEIIYNQYMQINYLIISYTFNDSEGGKSIINIFKFINNKLFKINDVCIEENNFCKRQKLFLIWEDKISQTFYLITSNYNFINFIEINDNKNEYYNSYEIENEHPIYYEYDLFACIINNKNNKNYLYICDNEGNFKILDLNEKVIINKI